MAKENQAGETPVEEVKEVPMAQNIPLGGQPVRPVVEVAKAQADQSADATLAASIWDEVIGVLDAGLKKIGRESRTPAAATLRNHLIVWLDGAKDERGRI